MTLNRHRMRIRTIA